MDDGREGPVSMPGRRGTYCDAGSSNGGFLHRDAPCKHLRG